MAGFISQITGDTLTPFIGRVQANAKNPAAVWRGMGNTLLAITVGNFNSVGAHLRPIAWKDKRDGTPSNLQLTTALRQSWRLNVTSSYAMVSSDRKYAAIHQFGGTPEMKRNHGMPARPMLPITPDGKLTPAAEPLVLAAGMRAFLLQAAPWP